MSLTGKPTDCNTITMVTRPALGIEAAPIEAIVAVKLIMIYWIKVRGVSFICAMNIGAIAFLLNFLVLRFHFNELDSYLPRIMLYHPC